MQPLKISPEPYRRGLVKECGMLLLLFQRRPLTHKVNLALLHFNHRKNRNRRTEWKKTKFFDVDNPNLTEDD